MTGPSAPVERLHQSIARQIGTAILAGEHLPGTYFDGEIERSLALGVSRTAYREAIRILVAKGLLASKPKTGTHVTDRRRWNVLDPDILAWTFSGDADESFIRELFELRAIIEPEAAALAAARRSAADLSAMADALDDMAEHGLADAKGQAGDQRFHRLIIEASGNRPLGSLAESVGAAVAWTTRFKARHQRLPRDSMAEHRAVYDAVAGSDPASARGAMFNLIDHAFADMGIFPASENGRSIRTLLRT